MILQVWNSGNGEDLTAEQIAGALGGADVAFGTQTNVKALSEDEIVSLAEGITRGRHRQIAADVIEDLKRAIEADEIESADGISDWLHETIDGHGTVIYTARAQEYVMLSSNDGAYFEEFGPDGAVEDGAINWSRLCYAALMADVNEELGSHEDYFDAIRPECDECSARLTAKEAEDGETTCADCRAKAEDDETDETDDDEPSA